MCLINNRYQNKLLAIIYELLEIIRVRFAKSRNARDSNDPSGERNN